MENSTTIGTPTSITSNSHGSLGAPIRLGTCLRGRAPTAVGRPHVSNIPSYLIDVSVENEGRPLIRSFVQGIALWRLIIFFSQRVNTSL